MFTKRDTNVCKGIAILMMLFHHLFNDYEEYAGHVISYWPFTGDQVTSLACLCGGCVTVFVFLTGYGTAASYEKTFGNNPPDSGDLTRLIGRRWLMLMQRYWMVFFLVLLASPLGRTPAQVYGTEWQAGIFRFLVDLLGLSDMFGTPTLNPTWWYISLAVYLIILTPFLIMAMKKTGVIPVFAAVMAVLGLFGIQNGEARYCFGLLLGITCLEFDIFGKIKNRLYGSRLWTAAAILLIVLLVAFVVGYRLDYTMFGVVDGVVAFLIALLSFLFFAKLSLVGDMLAFLGKHSANIFLTHNLLYSYYFLDFYYSFRYPVLILLVLTGTSLLLSILIEKLMAFCKVMESKIIMKWKA